MESKTIEAVFLILKSDESKYSVQFVKDNYDIVDFECPVAELQNFDAYCDFYENFVGNSEIRELPQETDYYRLQYKSFVVGVTFENIIQQ